MKPPFGLDIECRVTKSNLSRESRPKGGFMGTRGLHLAVISLLLLGVMVAGCAMRPATTAASGAGRSAPAPAAGAPGSSSASNPSGAARPVPSECVAGRDLQDIHFDFDRYDIRPDDVKMLDANAAWLKANADRLRPLQEHPDQA